MEKELLEKIYKSIRAIIWLLIVIIIFFIFTISKLYSKETTKSTSSTEGTEEEYNTDYDVSTFKEIKASNIKSETKGQTRVLYIGRETCGWCAAFLPNLWEAEEKYDYETLYIDLGKIIDFTKDPAEISDQASYDTLSNLKGEGDYDGYVKENLGRTPMILIVKDNKVINAQTGYSDFDTFDKVLKDSGFKE